MYRAISVPFFDVEIRSYHLCHGIAYLTFGLLWRLLTRRHPELNRHWWRLAILLVFGDLGMAHAANAVMLRGVGALALPSTWWPFGSGYWGGPLFAAVLVGAYTLVYRFPAHPALDALGISGLVTAGLSKVGCLLNGCCYGPRCSPDWWLGVQGRHPLPLYEAVLYISGAVLLTLWRDRVLRGRIVLVMGLYYGLIQILIQPLRTGSDMSVVSGVFFSLRQAIALVAVSFCAAMLLLSVLKNVVRKQGDLVVDRSVATADDQTSIQM